MTWPLLLAVQAFATMSMVGLIWFVQIVHYPLFGKVGAGGFSDYESSHQARTTIVVAPLMLTEAATAVLTFAMRPVQIAAWVPIAGAVLLAMIWLSTACWQMPAHAKLAAQFDVSVHRWLVASNWVRTFAWTARGVLVCWLLTQ